MKRLLIALLVGGMVFGAAFAAAAALDVSAGVLQAGGDTDLKCETTGVTVSWQNVHYDDTEAAYVLDTVVVDDIDAACDGYFIEVTLTDDLGAAIAVGSQPALSSPTASIGVSPSPVDVEDVEDVHVVIR